MKKLLGVLISVLLVFTALVGCSGVSTLKDFEEDLNSYLMDVQHGRLDYDSQGINDFGKPTMNYVIYQDGLPVAFLFVEVEDGEHVSNLTLVVSGNSVEMAEAFFDEMEDIANIDFEEQTFFEDGTYVISSLDLLGNAGMDTGGEFY